VHPPPSAAAVTQQCRAGHDVAPGEPSLTRSDMGSPLPRLPCMPPATPTSIARIRTHVRLRR
jgi:hypothetical protein